MKDRIVPSILGEREQIVLELVGQGFTNKAIAECLGTSPETVKAQLANIRTKFFDINLIKESDLKGGGHTRGSSAKIALAAAELGWIAPIASEIIWSANVYNAD